MIQQWSLADGPGVERSLARIAEIDSLIEAFVPEPDRRGRVEAELAALPAANNSLLYKFPVGIKDIIRVDGLPTRAGSEVPPDVLAGPQAPVVDRLRGAGAVVAGKTATAEFAASAPGPTRNPHNPEHTPGGSSSGSAAAVASGMVPLALGTQTVGSVIRPAAYCGIVGFKPTYGRVPVDGVIANAPSFDTVGVFAVDVRGVGVGAAVLCDEWRPVAADRRPVLGVPVGPYLKQAEPAALVAFDEQVGVLRSAGFTVRDILTMDDFADIAAQSHVMNRYEIAASHEEWFSRFGSAYREQTAAAIEEGRRIDPDDYQKAVRHRRDVRERMASEMPVDVWIAPPATGPAPHSLATTGDSVMCMPWSYVGFPAITLPAGRADNGLPLGLQCVGHPGEDELLTAFAADLETALTGSR